MVLFNSSSLRQLVLQRKSIFLTVRMQYSFLPIYHFPSISSTMDQARLLLQKIRTNPIIASGFAVIATEQTNGQGSKGRSWISPPGNCYVTIAIHSNLIHFPTTLLPLKFASIVATRIHSLLQCHLSSKVTVKWPNDILVNDKKMAGILITREQDYLMIGLGVNVKRAPIFSTKGVQRPSTCLFQYIKSDTNGINESKKIANIIIDSFLEYLQYIKTFHKKEILASEILQEWERWMEFGRKQKMRGREENRVVFPIEVDANGKLKVRYEDGTDGWLYSEYLE